MNLYNLSKFFKCIFFNSALTIFYFPVYAQEYITISPKGNNNNTGTLLHPLKTLEKALVVANGYLDVGKNVTIQLRGGTYYLDSTLIITKTSIANLLITAYKSETVNISAGRRLRLKWKLYKNGIYMASVPLGINFEILYVNGLTQVLARYPNYNAHAQNYNGTAADAVSKERIKSWANPQGGYLHALHASRWGSFDYLMTGVDMHGNLKLTGGWQNNRPAPMHKELRFVENIFE